MFVGWGGCNFRVIVLVHVSNILVFFMLWKNIHYDVNYTLNNMSIMPIFSMEMFNLSDHYYNLFLQ